MPLWVSGALPGSTHDLTAARELVLPQARPYLNILPFLADSGFEGSGAGVLVPGLRAWEDEPGSSVFVAASRFAMGSRRTAA